MDNQATTPAILKQLWGAKPTSTLSRFSHVHAQKSEQIEIFDTRSDWFLDSVPEEEEMIPTRPRLTATARTKTQTQTQTRTRGNVYIEPTATGRQSIGKDIQIYDTPLSSRIPQKEQLNLHVSGIFMNNREYFTKFIRDYFAEFHENPLAPRAQVTCADLTDSEGTADLLKHQELVRKYINDITPYRGLLLMHGLGAGKTRSSIAIAEGMRTGRKIIVMVPASLERNYIEEIKKWGDPLFRVKQFWEWIDITSHLEWVASLSATLGLSPEYIRKSGGVWLVNATKKENPNLNKENLKSLNKQIEQMIRRKYQFIRYNGLRMPSLQLLTDEFTRNPFDNACVIIDEAHNLIGRIVNKINKSRTFTKKERGGEDAGVSLKLYEYLMSATNAKIIMLTGTPIVNYPHEIGVLFNILRGYIQTWSIPVQADRSITKNSLQDMLSSELNMDYLQYDSTLHIITITRNPLGFTNRIDNQHQYEGVNVYDERVESPNKIFIQSIVDKLTKHGINPRSDQIKVVSHMALPDTSEQFNQMFVNSEKLEIMNPAKFSKRIIGLSSYFRSAQEDLLPAYERETDRVVIHIPMSDFQFGIYETARIDERDQEKSTKKNARDVDLMESSSSTYRIFSRLACNFVMPKEIGRPVPRPSNEKDNVDAAASLDGYKDEDAMQREDDELEGDEVMEVKGSVIYRQQIKSALASLWDRRNDFLLPEGLQTFSPKFLAILQNISDPENIGLHLIYSQFRNMEGIAIFGMILEANGFGRLKVKRSSSDQKEWVLDIAAKDKDKPLYALYTGTEAADEREVIRNIYNGEWHRLSPDLEKELLRRSPNNARGEIVKVIMITAAGSEGINLRNTRFVHIVEPYWHPVRTEQVIGRARRICSHQQLPIELQTVKVFIYLMTLTSEQIHSDKSIELRRRDKSKLDEGVYVTSDEALFEISSMKEKLIGEMLTLVKATSVDCAVYAEANSKEGVQCMQFTNRNIGQPDKKGIDSRKMAFSFVPDFMADPNDRMADVNTQVITNQNFVEVKQSGKLTYYKKRGSNMLYDIASVNEGDPRYIGKLVREVDGSYAIDTIA